MAINSPCGFPGSTILFQNSLYVAMNMQEILYGIELALYIKTMRAIMTCQREHGKHDTFYATFSTVMVLFVTMWMATRSYFGLELWVLNGTSLCDPVTESKWYVSCGSVAMIMLQLMTDALMMYRCWATWNTRSVIVFPIFLWVTSLTLGILTAWSSGTQQGNLILGVTSELGLAYYTVTVFLNVLLAGMICYRMIRFGRLIKKHLGHECSSVYFSVVALMVESMLPYTLTGIAFLVSFGMGSQATNAFLSVYVMMTCLSTQILTFRVYAGRKQDKDKQTMSIIEFAAGTHVQQCVDEQLTVSELV